MQHKTIEGYRLAPQQEYLWLLRDVAESPAYRVSCAVTISGAVDAARIEGALKRIVERHEILRTEFAGLDGMAMPLQVINDAGRVEIELHDFSLYGVAERQAMIESAFKAERNQACSYDRGLTLHAKLFRASADEQTLILSLPAMYSDSAGLRILIRELSSYLNENCSGSPSGELLQYADYAQILHELTESEEAGIGKDYWVKQVIPDLSTLKLSIEKDVDGKTGFVPESLAALFDADLTAKAEALARQRETGLSALLLACWQLLVGKLTAQSEIAIGLTCDGRTYEGLSEAVGLFAKSVPLVGLLRQDLTFHELLKQTAESMRDASRRQEYFSWKRLSEQGEAPASRKNFPICYEFEEQMYEAAAGAFTLRIDRLTAITERYLLKLKCERRGDELRAEFIYDAGRFDRGAVERLARQYVSLVRAATESPEAALRELSLLGADERRQLLEDWNRTEVEWGAFRPLHQWFEEQVEMSAQRTAIEMGAQRLSYRELNERANRLARRLRRQGVGPETVVGVLMERSVEMVVGALGTLKAGAAYLPLDGSYPEQRLNYMMKNAGVSVLLTQERMSDKWAGNAAEVICVDGAWDEIAEESGENLGVVVEEENLAYVIYTSGSTGKPKGVMVTQGGLRNYLKWSVEAYGMKDGGGSVLHSPLGFDLTVTGLYPALLEGGRLRLTNEVEGVGGLSEALRRERGLGLVKLTPAHLEALSQWMPGEEMEGRTKALVIGGEALFGERLKKWREYAPGTRLINEYGPTETVVGCCVYEVGENEKIFGSVPIGRPIANTKMYILDEKQEPVGIGESGEIYIGGAGLARGYMGRAEETAERFVPNPYGEKEGERLYRTGDVGRRRWDGEIEYLGRKDQQVKLRGYRIELGEIEAELSQIEGVGEAVVLMREDGGGKRLVGYVSEESREGEGKRLKADELKKRLRERLPEYMTPTDVVILEEMPLTANGKIERKALPAPATLRPESDVAYVAPRSGMEHVIADLWREALNLDKVGRSDNFFDLGGHSLLMLELHAKLQETFKTELALVEMFKYPTVASLSEYLGQNSEIGLDYEQVKQRAARRNAALSRQKQRKDRRVSVNE